MDETSILIILNKEQFEYFESLIPEGSDYRPINIEQINEEINTEKERNFVKPEFLKDGMKIKHLKHAASASSHCRCHPLKSKKEN